MNIIRMGSYRCQFCLHRSLDIEVKLDVAVRHDAVNDLVNQFSPILTDKEKTYEDYWQPTGQPDPRFSQMVLDHRVRPGRAPRH